jgi:hypothetical protein
VVAVNPNRYSYIFAVLTLGEKLTQRATFLATTSVLRRPFIFCLSRQQFPFQKFPVFSLKRIILRIQKILKIQNILHKTKRSCSLNKILIPKVGIFVGENSQLIADFNAVNGLKNGKEVIDLS